MIRKLFTKALVHRKLRKDFNSGKLSPSDFRNLKQRCTSEVCEAAVRASAAKSGLRESYPRLAALWDYIVENWDDILKFILMVIPMVLDERDV